MCLDISKSPTPKIAAQDIVCYKYCFLQKTIHLPWSLSNPFMLKTRKILKTPFQDAIVEIGQTYKSELILGGTNYNSVFEGLHTYANKPPTSYRDGKLIKCVIPKGATYYEGLGFWKPGYASNELRYVKVLL